MTSKFQYVQILHTLTNIENIFAGSTVEIKVLLIEFTYQCHFDRSEERANPRVGSGEILLLVTPRFSTSLDMTLNIIAK